MTKILKIVSRMNMKKFEKIYEENKKLDEIFNELYDNNSSDTFRKNVLELLVELGELANETRCFKYWSSKGPSDKKIILEEFADCMLMTLCFCNMLEVDLKEEFIESQNNDAVEQFISLYYESSKLISDFNKDRIKTVLVNLIKLGNLIELSDEDIINGCLLKIEKNMKRFEMGF